MSFRGNVRGEVVASLAVLWSIMVVSTTVHGAFGDARPKQDPGTSSLALPAATGSDTVRNRCVTCHGADLIVQQRLSREGWTREVDKMIAWGAVVNEAEKGQLVEYLAGQFASTRSLNAPDRSDSSEARIVTARCLTCHDRRLIDQQRLTAEGWTRVIDKMVGWGATVSAAERAELVEHFTSLSSSPP
jgi:cytochrome c553